MWGGLTIFHSLHTCEWQTTCPLWGHLLHELRRVKSTLLLLLEMADQMNRWILA